MLKKSLCVLILASMCAAQVQAGTIITAVERRNSTRSPAPLVSATPLTEGVTALNNRGYVFSAIPEWLVGADFIQMNNDDKYEATVEFDVTLAVPATLYVMIDPRIGDENAGDPPTVGPKMQWVLDMGFESTGEKIGLSDGQANGYYIYALDVPAGTITLKEQNDGGTRNIYSIAAVERALPFTARNPVPANGKEDVIRKDLVLSWIPGDLAATHDVYLGTDFDDVNTATAASPLLVSASQDANSYAPTALLEFGQTYYWRVDEVNATPDNTVFKGDVWSFTVEPYTYPITNITVSASSSHKADTGPEKTIDSSGLDADDLHGTVDTTMWLSDSAAPLPAWIEYQFDRIYKLQEMWVWNSNQSLESFAGLGAKDVTIEYATDASDWKVLAGVPEFTRAPGAASYAHDTTIDFGGVAASKVRLTINSNWGGFIPQTGLSEVRFYYLPLHAREPQPAAGATDVNPNGLTLTWRAGREAASHDVYLGTDPNAVADGTAPKVNTTQASHAPAVEIDATYYWKVNEVNTAEPWPVWESSVWSFSTPEFLAVDDFESYNDQENMGTRIYETWIDGWDTPEINGGIVGYGDAPFAEKTVVHGGKQSMPFSYDNSGTAKTSEATRTFAEAQDWAGMDGQTLVLFFYGDTANTGQLYVKINSTKIPYGSDASNVARRRWNQWNLDLTAVPESVLQSVRTLTIGVSGGAGELFIDDVRLYRVAPEVPVAVDPGTAGLMAYYAMDNNVQDGSGKGNHGTLVSAPVYVDGQAGFGKALQFNGITDCVDLGNKPVFNFAGSFSLSVWANITTWTSNWGHAMVGNRGESNMGWQLRRRDSNKICFTTRGVGNDDLGSNMDAPVGEWVHIAAVYDNVNNTKRIYINGVEDIVGNTNAGATLAATTHNTYIGARANGGNTGPEAFFAGMLDDVRIYDRVLSAGEVEFLSDPTP